MHACMHGLIIKRNEGGVALYFIFKFLHIYTFQDKTNTSRPIVFSVWPIFFGAKKTNPISRAEH